MIDRLVRRREVCERTGLSYTTIWRLEKSGIVPAPPPTKSLSNRHKCRRRLARNPKFLNEFTTGSRSPVGCRRLITTEPRHEARRARAAALKARTAPCRPSQGAAFSNTRKPTASYYCKSIFRILSSVCARQIPG